MYRIIVRDEQEQDKLDSMAEAVCIAVGIEKKKKMIGAECVIIGDVMELTMLTASIVESMARKMPDNDRHLFGIAILSIVESSCLHDYVEEDDDEEEDELPLPFSDSGVDPL